VLQKYGVTANAIMPRARTRMNDTPMLAAMFAKPEAGFDVYAPENVSPLVAWLGSREASQVSGYVMIVYGKEIVVVDRPTLGHKFVSGDAWTVDSVGAELGAHFAKLKPVTDGFTVPPM
jgi:3-oxoacyl-[acyl-carrier protein] reductase